jgi:hypothetical protein
MSLCPPNLTTWQSLTRDGCQVPAAFSRQVPAWNLARGDHASFLVCQVPGSGAAGASARPKTWRDNPEKYPPFIGGYFRVSARVGRRGQAPLSARFGGKRERKD